MPWTSKENVGQKNVDKNLRFCCGRMSETSTVHFRYSVPTMMARMAQTHIRTTLRTIVSQCGAQRQDDSDIEDGDMHGVRRKKRSIITVSVSEAGI